MTMASWTPIVVSLIAAAATILAPVLGELVKNHIDERKIARANSKPRTPNQIVDSWLMRLVGSPWIIPPLLMVLNASLLINQLRENGPITRGSIFVIAVSVAAIVYNLANMQDLVIWRNMLKHLESTSKHSDITGRIIDSNEKQSEITGRIIAVVEKLQTKVEILEGAQRKQKSHKQGK